MSNSTTALAVALPATESRQPEPDRQPRLPIKLDAKRSSDRIRARIYHDGRIRNSAGMVAMVLSEHIRYDDDTYSCVVTYATIARWTHCSIRAVKVAVRELRDLGVIDFGAVHHAVRYVFTLDWVARWTVEESRGRLPESSAESALDRRESSADIVESSADSALPYNRVEPSSTHSARDAGRAAGPSESQLDLGERFGVQPEPGETGAQLYERIATAKRGRTALPRGRANKGVAPTVKSRPCGCRDGKPNPTNYQCDPGWWQCTRCCERVECDHTHGTESYGGEAHCKRCGEVSADA